MVVHVRGSIENPSGGGLIAAPEGSTATDRLTVEMGRATGGRVRTILVGLAWWTLVAAAAARADPPYAKARIPHRDRSGRATIVELHPDVPGARAFVAAEERPAPDRGELELPTPAPSASAAPSPTHRY